MEDGIEVDSAELTAHARTLGNLAAELRAVVTAVGAIGMTDSAYGELGRPFAAALDGLGKVGEQALEDGVTALETASSTLTATAAAYERHDDAEAERLNVITEELPTS